MQATQIGEIIYIPFPNVSPYTTEEEIKDLAIAVLGEMQKVKFLSKRRYNQLREKFDKVLNI